MATTRYNDRSDLIRKLAILAARAVSGLALAFVLSMVGLAIAWGLFVFSSFSSRDIFMAMNTVGSAIGAGAAASLAWVPLDRQQRSVLALTLLLCVAGGVVGGILGYQFGANREMDCCAEPRTSPFLYTAIGATILANIVMYLFTAGSAAARMIRTNRRETQR